jgi:serine/threonine protein phosphatase 1
LPHRTLAIGDIHGCLDLFEAVLQSVVPTPDDHLVLLGDYVDRGPDPGRVIRRIIRLAGTHHVTALMGNHEQMMLAARDSHNQLADWLGNGGDQTLRSYAGVRGTLRDVPVDHWHFLSDRLVDYLETDTHIFVHANGYPDQPMERCDRIGAHESGKTIVCGHTPQPSGRPMNRGYAVCIDTHACGGGPLTCLEAGSGKVWRAFADGKVERGHLSDFVDD